MKKEKLQDNLGHLSKHCSIQHFTLTCYNKIFETQTPLKFVQSECGKPKLRRKGFSCCLQRERNPRKIGNATRHSAKLEHHFSKSETTFWKINRLRKRAWKQQGQLNVQHKMGEKRRTNTDNRGNLLMI